CSPLVVFPNNLVGIRQVPASTQAHSHRAFVTRTRCKKSQAVTENRRRYRVGSHPLDAPQFCAVSRVVTDHNLPSIDNELWSPFRKSHHRRGPTFQSHSMHPPDLAARLSLHSCEERVHSVVLVALKEKQVLPKGWGTGDPHAHRCYSAEGCLPKKLPGKVVGKQTFRPEVSIDTLAIRNRSRRSVGILSVSIVEDTPFVSCALPDNASR